MIKQLRFLLLALVFALSLAQSAFAQNPQGPYTRPFAPQGIPLANATNTNFTIQNTNTLVTLAAPASNVTILNTSSTATIYVDFTGGAATTGDFPIPPGYAFTFTGLPLVERFRYIGSAAGDVAGVFAH